MSKRNKLHRFAEILSFANVYENFTPRTGDLLGKDGEPTNLKGAWSAQHFQNDKPITLELACGKGHYTLGLARLYPERNFIGVDIKGARIWRGAKTALEDGLDNVAFLRTRIEQISHFFEVDEVDEIWITFPDPFLSKENRRMTAPRFLTSFAQILRPEGIINIKTDSPDFYEFSLETLTASEHFNIEYQDDDIYAKALPMPELDIKTEYEGKHLAIGRTIKYIKARLVNSIAD